MRKIKTFEFRGYKKCSLSVRHYNKEKAIAIAVIDMETDEEIETLTVLDVYADYEVGVATVIGDFIDGDEVTGYKTATDILIQGNVSRKKRKKVVDSLAATIILQSFLDKKGTEIK